MSAILILIICISLGGGCAKLLPRPEGIRAADERTVTGCEFLGTVGGSSGWAWLVQEAALESAEAEALNKAVEMGATHLIWTQNESSGWSERVWGRAYKCR